MAKYKIVFAKSARKELEKLLTQIVGRIFERIEALGSEPRPANSLKLKGELNLWRVRIGDYRVVYSIDDRKSEIDISTIRHRKDVYRDL